MSRARHWIFAIRPEEWGSLLLFLPTAYALARMSAVHADTLTGVAATYPGAFARLIGILAATVVLFALVRVAPRWGFLRDSMPFVFAATIYASLHDLIRFFHAPDITAALHRWDVALFGFEPTIWAERFNHPVLTDVLTVCYWLFYVLAPVLGLILYLRKDMRAFRATMVSVMLCLYLGYIGYVVWPASAPRLFMPGAYSVRLHGLAFLDTTRAATVAVPLTAHGAFPSLHCAVALLAVLLAWRYQRWFAWVQLPFATGLVLGTVYLRHHWVVDILAGFVLTVFSFWAGPRLAAWWAAQSGERDDAPRVTAGSERAADAAVGKRDAAPPARVAAKVMES
jgi:membrane-associated phospholipid phosphatase